MQVGVARHVWRARARARLRVAVLPSAPAAGRSPHQRRRAGLHRSHGPRHHLPHHVRPARGLCRLDAPGPRAAGAAVRHRRGAPSRSPALAAALGRFPRPGREHRAAGDLDRQRHRGGNLGDQSRRQGHVLPGRTGQLAGAHGVGAHSRLPLRGPAVRGVEHARGHRQHLRRVRSLPVAGALGQLLLPPPAAAGARRGLAPAQRQAGRTAAAEGRTRKPERALRRGTQQHVAGPVPLRPRTEAGGVQCQHRHDVWLGARTHRARHAAGQDPRTSHPPGHPRR
jgi:hypothetical protein